MSSISGLANDIFVNEFDSTGISVGSISGWLDANVGQLNTVLFTSFSGQDGNISGMQLEEANIYKEMYLHHYYTKQTRSALRGISDASAGNNGVLSVRDGEQTITFVNRNEVSKVYKGLASDSYERLQDLIHDYKSFQTSPRQVGGIESVVQITGTN